MFLLIDNYDSFTYNLRHYLGELGAGVEVRRNDALGADEAMALDPEGIVLSPGPCDPDRAGICLELIAKAAGRIPILGVCLGHQCIGQAFGGRVVRGPKPMHGKVSPIRHREMPIHGVLFHPESIASEHGHRLLRNFLDMAARGNMAA